MDELTKLIKEQQQDDTNTISQQWLHTTVDPLNLDFYVSKDPTPDQVVEARLDGICPFCNAEIEAMQDYAWCAKCNTLF